MVELDAVWGKPRSVKINGKNQRVPFGVELEPSLVDFLNRWIQSSGIAFAAKRMKALKVWAIHILAGKKDYQEVWFKIKSYKGYRIPSLSLFEYLIDNQHNLKVIKLILIVLNSYKLVTLGRPSLESVLCKESEPSDQYISKLRLYCKLPTVPPEVLEVTEAVNTRKKFADDFGTVDNGPYGLKDFSVFGHDEHNWNPHNLGKLIPIPDKGKWRNILIGHWAVQLKTKKLADWLRQWLWKQPEIASGDQSKMSKFITSNLTLGKYMMSIDLSEATDRLSKDLQIKLLISMGVPEHFLRFFRIPFLYQGLDFGMEKGLKAAWYGNGQPMGLFLSFPMFELAHYVILKFAVATSTATFTICGDDVVVALDSERDRDKVFDRYRTLIERFGGIISSSKTIMSSRLAEGIGAIFLKGIPKEIRIPSGKLSVLEALTPGTWLYRKIVQMQPVGRALMSSWLSSSLTGEYTYQQRSAMNEFMVSTDLSDWSIQALRLLYENKERMPQTYDRFDQIPDFWRDTPKEKDHLRYRYVTMKAYRDNLVSNKIVSLYRNDTKG